MPAPPDLIPPDKKRFDATVPLVLAAILMPDPPPNDLDEVVVAQLVEAYRRKDPVPAVTVYAIAEGKYRLLFGMHRLTAAARAGLTEIMAIILSAAPSKLEEAAMQFRENNARKKLTVLEMAGLILRAMAEGLIGKQVARLYGISEAHLSRCLAIHRNLVEELKLLVSQNQIAPKTAYALARIPQPLQVAFYRDRCTKKTCEEVEQLVSEEIARIEGATPKVKPVAVVLGNLKAMIPHEPEEAMTVLKKVLAAVKAVGDRGGNCSDVPAWLRLNG